MPMASPFARNAVDHSAALLGTSFHCFIVTAFFPYMQKTQDAHLMHLFLGKAFLSHYVAFF